MHKVLLIEDNEDLAYGLRNNLEIEGYAVDVAHDGAVGLERMCTCMHDLVILDLMLPRMGGYQVLKTARAQGVQIPVLILTARGEETDKVLGFRLGADDYVTKPFGVLELLARVQALLRRSRPENGHAQPVERFGDVEVRRSERSVINSGVPVSLTPKELDLLLALVDRRGKVASRIELMREVWGHRAAVQSRTVDTHVAELRRKLELDAARPRHILTVRKAGYRFNP